MLKHRPTLHLLCGKIASGKSTLARRLASQPATLLISEDEWLARLYPGEIVALADYIRCSTRLREVMTDHVVSLLRTGLSIVLDFPVNTIESRRTMRGIADRADAMHRLHYLELPDDICRARLRQRNLVGTHDFSPTDADFDLFTRYFVPPSSKEGMNVEMYRKD